MDELTKATAAHLKATERANAARHALHLAIVAAAAEGRAQVEIARVTGYTRERIRQIVKLTKPARRR